MLNCLTELSAGVAANILLGLTLVEHAVVQKNLEYFLR